MRVLDWSIKGLDIDALPDRVFEDDYELMERLESWSGVIRANNLDGTFRPLTEDERAARSYPVLTRALLNSIDFGECWIWLGPRNSMGYGRISFDGKNRLLHRAAHEETKGPIPPGLVIDHLCNEPLCFRPQHLEAVTQQENMRRAFAGRQRTECKKGHPMTPDNTYIVRVTGQRQCKTCIAARSRAYRKAIAEGWK